MKTLTLTQSETYDEYICDCPDCIYDAYDEDDMASLDEFICIECNINTSDIQEYYMIQDYLWKQVNPQINGMLCIGCVETKLGRTLISTDFPSYPVNQIGVFLKSERLINRLTTHS